MQLALYTGNTVLIHKCKHMHIHARIPSSTLFLSGYTKVDHMYCNILIPTYSGSVQLYIYISNPERQYTVHTYTVYRQC